MAGITSAVIGLAGSVYAAKQASKQAKEQKELGQQAIEAADPYKEYRPEAAAQLAALMKDPSQIVNTADYKARLEAAARTVAAQGYTGSGNAILEAANAGGAAYDAAFDKLAILSGANVAPGGGYSSAIAANQAGYDNKLSSIAGVTNNLANLALSFNKPASSSSAPASSGSSGTGTIYKSNPISKG